MLLFRMKCFHMSLAELSEDGSWLCGFAANMQAASMHPFSQKEQVTWHQVAEALTGLDWHCYWKQVVSTAQN